MKKIILFLAFIVVSHTLSSQINTNPAPAGGTWQTAILRADGLAEINGVEAYCMKTTCGTEDVVLVKFINKNNYKVRVEWKDAIKVNGEWFYSNDQAAKTLELDPNSNTAGQCTGLEKLKVKVASIINDPKDFGHYTVSGLVTIKLK